MQELITYLIISTSLIIAGKFFYSAVTKSKHSDCSTGCGNCAENKKCDLQLIKIKK